MSELELEPYAAQQRWQMPAAQPGTAWQHLLGDYLRDLARACATADTGDGRRPVVGHLKLLALFPDHGYLRVSAVSPAHPATCTGSVPDGLAELSLTLNVLVYGLPRPVVAELATRSASALAATCGGSVTVEDEPASHHHHDHGHAEDEPEQTS